MSTEPTPQQLKEWSAAGTKFVRMMRYVHETQNPDTPYSGRYDGTAEHASKRQLETIAYIAAGIHYEAISEKAEELGISIEAALDVVETNFTGMALQGETT